MAKQIKQEKRPKKMDQLTEYIVDESVREGATPDRSSQGQISMLLAEGKERSAAVSKRKKTAQKASKARRGKKKTSK